MLTLLTIFAVQAVAVAAAWLLQQQETRLRTRLHYLVAIAVGVLVATALLHLLPESLTALGNRRGLWVAMGVTFVVLFAFERIFEAITGMLAEPQPVPAAHGPGCDHLHVHGGSVRPANLVLASSLHSFVDGTAIATAFAVNRTLGLLTAAAVALHEIPHRMGDVAVLLHLGVRPARAMRLAMLVAVPSLAGAGVVLALGAGYAGVFRWLLPISAASFLYIAGANLLPELHGTRGLRAGLLQLLALGTGAGIVWLVTGFGAG